MTQNGRQERGQTTRRSKKESRIGADRPNASGVENWGRGRRNALLKIQLCFVYGRRGSGKKTIKAPPLDSGNLEGPATILLKGMPKKKSRAIR